MTGPDEGGRGAGWAKRLFAISLFVDDLPAARDFYRDVFGMPAVAEDDTSIAFRFPNVVVNLVTASSAAELIEPAPVGPPGTPGRAMYTLQVDDVDAACARLQERDVALLNGPMDRPWGPRTAAFADPSGHCWELSD
ncbi:MAG TPA: VOC family protein [Candidatus Dormibacteraeota bacterium]|nr:VOC family protein [Candidatus Dormibacteraeota bacterium]